ncbi:hypothetical protein B0H17DRAFT_1215570 [Mycena rosella]|nr:hypothetical protein B0H17DRAFT_1215570 [Mycena rosella]
MDVDAASPGPISNEDEPSLTFTQEQFMEGKDLWCPFQMTSAPAPESPKLGGLTDEDALAEHPKFVPKTRALPKNNMVTVFSSDSEETLGKSAEIKTAQTMCKQHRVRVKPKLLTSKIPALSIGHCTTPMIKTESSSSFSPVSTINDNGLPTFISRTWTSLFLPATYRALALSKDPMAIEGIGTDPKRPGVHTVSVLQAVLDDVYPGNTWVMEWGDAICAKVISRIGERHAAIAKMAVGSINRIFKGVSYYEDLKSRTPAAHKTAQIGHNA